MRLKLFAAGLASAAAMGLAGPALAAGTPALSIELESGSRHDTRPFTLGWKFETTKAFTIDALGIFDDSRDGLGETHEVGLWSLGGTLLASTTVARDAELIENFRYADIDPLALDVGVYYIGAFYNSPTDRLIAPGLTTPHSTIAGIDFLSAVFATSPTLTRPAFEVGPSGFFGPNFSVAPVPEPATWAMLITGFGGIGVMLRTRRRFGAPA